MDILPIIKTRRSVRSYKNKKVEKEKLFKILEAGRWSPSSGNIQSWRFVVINSDKKKIELAEACLGQYWIEKVPVLIVLVSDDTKLKMLFGQRGEKMYSYQNCAVAMQSMMLEATAIGLGSCWIGAFDEERIKRILKIDDESIKIRSIMAIGYGKEDNPIPPTRMPLDRISFFNEFGNRIM